MRSNFTFLLYLIGDFVPLCVVEIKCSGAQESSRLVTLRNMLGTAGLPLVEFPVLDRYALQISCGSFADTSDRLDKSPPLLCRLFFPDPFPDQFPDTETQIIDRLFRKLFGADGVQHVEFDM